MNRMVRVGEVTLQVADVGSGRPLVLLHGFPLDHAMWHKQIAAFSTRCRVIAPDLRGFGSSDVSEADVTIEQMADDTNALLDALEIDEPIVLVGLSMGGYVAFQFWRKYRQWLRALVLCDTRAVSDTNEASKARHAMAEQVLREGTHPAAEAMLPRLFAPGTAREQPEAVAAVQRTILAASPVGVAAALHALAQRPDVSDYLPRLDLPTLVMVGEHDAISTVAEMRGLAAAIPASEFVIIPSAGHMSPLEQPAAFNAALSRFLDRVGG